MYLLKKLEALWSGVDIGELKKVCIRDIRLSKELKNNLKNAINLDETFDLLSDSPFCSWLEITILERMAKTAEIPEALQLIKTFKECVHKRKCSEIKWLHFNKLYVEHQTKTSSRPTHTVTILILIINRENEYNNHSAFYISTLHH